MNPSSRRWALSISVLAIGVIAAIVVTKLKPKVARERPKKSVPNVLVIDATLQTLPAQVNAAGNVIPAQEVNLIPEVSGKLTYVSKKLVAGSQVEKGELLLRIDPRQYRLAIQQERSRIRQAQLDLELEKGRVAVAKREWELIGGSDIKKGPAEPALALRKSQLATAEAALAAARSTFDQAKLNLERTAIRAPFRANVVSENVDLGQVVSPTTQIARLVAHDEVHVNVVTPVEALDLLELPRNNGQRGSKALVTQRLSNGKTIQRRGEIIQLIAELDRQTRRAQLLLRVEQPFDVELGLPMLPGAYVEVTFEGKEVNDVVALPASAIYDGNKVWTVSKKGLLAPQPIEVLWQTEDRTYVKGIVEGQTVMTSVLSAPIRGMKVNANTGKSKEPNEPQPKVTKPDSKATPVQRTQAKHG